MRFLSRPLSLSIFAPYSRLRGSTSGNGSLTAEQPLFLYIIRFIGPALFIFIAIFNSFFVFRRTFSDSNFISTLNSTLGFSHIYVIVANPDRGKYADKILQYHNLKYEVFPAFTRDSDFVNATVSSMWERNEGNEDIRIWGKIGCWASHRAIWTDALEKKHSTFLVLEDDIDVHLDIAKMVQAGWNGLPTRWDYYFLGSCFPSYVELWSSGPLKKLTDMACTHAYGVNSHITPKLLEWSADPPTTGIDLQAITSPLQNGVIDAYGLVPPAIIQRPLAFQHQSVISGGEEPTYLNGPGHLMKDDWRIKEVFPMRGSTAEKLMLAYWY